jgi:hypothetical protein
MTAGSLIGVRQGTSIFASGVYKVTTPVAAFCQEKPHIVRLPVQISSRLVRIGFFDRLIRTALADKRPLSKTSPAGTTENCQDVSPGYTCNARQFQNAIAKTNLIPFETNPRPCNQLGQL